MRALLAVLVLGAALLLQGTFAVSAFTPKVLADGRTVVAICTGGDCPVIAAKHVLGAAVAPMGSHRVARPLREKRAMTAQERELGPTWPGPMLRS